MLRLVNPELSSVNGSQVVQQSIRFLVVRRVCVVNMSVNKKSYEQISLVFYDRRFA